MTIDVVMLIDSNYILQAKVAIYSACKNTNSEMKIIFTILCDEALNEDSRKQLAELEKIFFNIKINFYDITLKNLICAKSNHRVPKVSCYRLIAANVLNAKKAIYLDSDLIVEVDLVELYKIDIKEYYVAGVKDLYVITHPNFALWYADNYNIENFSDYINCGVLLMNLELMRVDNIVEKFLNELNHKNLWFDQDIINKVCHGKIHLINWKFNHISLYSNEEYEWNCELIKNKSGKEIVHFCGPEKPWINRYINMAERWWDIAKNILEEDIYNDLFRIASIGHDSDKISEIAIKCLKAKTIIIVGYSDHGIHIKNALQKYGITAEIFFCDNNQRKRTLMLIDKKIYSPEEASMEFKDAIWINVVQKFRNEIMTQLKCLNIPDNRIINYLFE